MLRIGLKLRKVETIVSCLAVRRVAVIAIALGMAFSTSAQWSVAKDVNPKLELIINKGIIRQDGKLANGRQVREIMYGNREAIQQYTNWVTPCRRNISLHPVTTQL